MSYFADLIRKRIGYKKPTNYNLNAIHLKTQNQIDKYDEVNYFNTTPIDNKSDGAIKGLKKGHSNPKEQQWTSKKLHEEAQIAYQDLKQILSS